MCLYLKFSLCFMGCLGKHELEQISCEAPDEYLYKYFELYFCLSFWSMPCRFSYLFEFLSFRLPRASCITQFTLLKCFCFSLFHSHPPNSLRSDWHFNTHYFRYMLSVRTNEFLVHSDFCFWANFHALGCCWLRVCHTRSMFRFFICGKRVFSNV